ncbi:MAG: hypothetical protein MI802_11610, partial [Desulfobacterales bacterium]|nr:hypothetical protein [Desulfobacterales bacterium]
MEFNKNTAGEPDRATFIEIERTNILVKNLFTSMSSTLVNSIILVIVLWNVIPRQQLIAWCLINIAFVLVRHVMIRFYRRGYKQDNYILWQRILIISFLIAGL